MRISIGSDHRGFGAKTRLVELLANLGHDVVDVGTDSSESIDYPDIASLVAGEVSKQTVDRGILICGTGIGMAVAANKFAGVRAHAIHDEVTAEMSRRHNDLNVLCLSGDMNSQSNLDRLVELWLNTEFEGGRHARRVDKISEMEK